MLKMKAVRLDRGWSQVDLAYHARMQPSEVSRIERGNARPYPGQAVRLAEALGLSETELLEPAGTAEPQHAA